jgi:predicted dinucleotide-binding enzyme
MARGKSEPNERTKSNERGERSGRGRGGKARTTQTARAQTSAGSRRVGIIGQGQVGSALERGLADAGYEVRTSSSDPQEVRDVGQWGEVLVLAVPFDARADAVRTLGDAITEKTVIDVTNALGEGYTFAGSTERSGAEELQEMAGDDACVVKAFNTVFATHMDKGGTGGEPLTVFVAGDDEEAKQEAADLAEAIGFDTVDSGPLENARWLETLGYLNIQLAQQPGVGGDGGFQYVRKGARRRTRSANANASGRSRPTEGRRTTRRRSAATARNR